MKNLTREKIFSKETNLNQKLGLFLLSPEIYEAENLNDIVKNSNKTKCPWYKLMRMYNDSFYRDISPPLYYFSNGAIIEAYNLWADLTKETEYIYNLSVRDSNNELKVNIFDWDKFFLDKSKMLEEYFFSNTRMTLEQYQNKKRLEGRTYREYFSSESERKRGASFFKNLEFEDEKFTKKSLRGLMPPFMVVDMEKVKEDFSKTNFIGTLRTFYSHRDNELYLFDYSKKNIIKRGRRKELFNKKFSLIPSPSY